MSRALAAILAALALSATACSGAPTPRGSTSAAPRLLEAALDAQGGRGAIERIEAVHESKAISGSRDPAIIISARGMCEAGRILHHLKGLA